MYGSIHRLQLAGEELAYSYGTAYWEMFADHLLDINYSKEQNKVIEELRDEIKGLSRKVNDQKKTISQLRRSLAASPHAGPSQSNQKASSVKVKMIQFVYISCTKHGLYAVQMSCKWVNPFCNHVSDQHAPYATKHLWCWEPTACT